MNIDSLLPEVKQIELEILNIVDEFCRKNDIKYSLAYGTMLGAVRHKGFIPWDDDIDIFMLRSDYERFEKLWLEKSPKGYILENAKINPNYTQCLTKIRKDNTCFLQSGEEKAEYHTGIFVDIFVLDRAANTKMQQKICTIYSALYYLYTRGFAFDRGSKLLRLGCEVLLGLVPKSKYKLIADKFENKLKKYNSSKNNKLVCYCTMESSKIFFPSDTMDDVEMAEFENEKFYISKCFDQILSARYGNYMKLPPKSERTWKHHPILIDFEHNYEELNNE